MARLKYWDGTAWQYIPISAGAHEHSAALVSLIDSGNYFTVDNVESALQEVAFELETTFQTGLEPDPLNLADRVYSTEVAVSNLNNRVSTLESSGVQASMLSQTINAVSGLNSINLNQGANVYVASTAGAWSVNFQNVPNGGVVVTLTIDVSTTGHELTIPNVSWYGTAPLLADWVANETNIIRLTKLPFSDKWVAEWIMNSATPVVVDNIPASLVSWSKTILSTASIAVPYPANIVAGNTLIIFLGMGSKTVTEAPAGFTPLRVWPTMPDFNQLRSWSKVAVGSETGSVTITLDSAVQNVAYMLQVSGEIDVSTPIYETIGGTFIDIPSLTASTSGLLLSFATSRDATAPYTSFSPPGSGVLIDQAVAQYDQQISAFSTETVNAGATGTRRWTYTNGGTVQAFNVIISDPEPGSTPPPDPDPEPTDPPVSTTFPSASLLAYGMFGEVYRSDGFTKDGIVIGAPPWGKHELVPLRLSSSFDWYHGARFGASPAWEQYFFSPWGQIFIGQGNTAANVRIQCRNAKTIYRDSGGVWRNFSYGDVSNWEMEGAYMDTYFNSSGFPADTVRNESANGGGWSVSLAPLVNNTNAATYHWWLKGYYPRPAWPSGATAFIVACEMRLIPDDTSPADPAADSTRFIASFGADAFSSATTGTPPIRGFTTPRMVRIRQDWRWVTGHAFSSWFANSSFGPATMLAQAPTSWPV